MPDYDDDDAPRGIINALIISTTFWLIVAMLLMAVSVCRAADIDRLLDAIEQVESGGRCDAVGDGGQSIGPFQIQRAYWTDSRVPGEYWMVRNRHYARRVVVAYWQRYCPRALARGDWQTLVRIHNGGPRGHLKPETLKYWNKVLTAKKQGSLSCGARK